MKIVVATPLYPPEPGGPATYSKLLEDGLPRLGIEVTLVKFSDVRHLPTGFRHLAYFSRVRRAAHDADLIYALDPASVGLPSLLASWFTRKPLVVKIVGDFAWEQGRQHFGVTATLDEFVRQRWISPMLLPYRLIQNLVARSANLVIVPSHYLEGIIAQWGVRRKNIRVVWNAVASENAGTVPASIVSLPKPLIVSIGRLVPWKGFAELIEAVSIARADGLHASLAIVGGGPDREFLEDRGKQALGSGYAFTGPLSRADALAVMARADVFVLDSLYEGLSHTLIEALTLGLPVIVSDIGGNTEIVRDGENGLVVPPENSAALATALERLLKDQTLRARLAAAAKASSAGFSVDAMLAKTAQCLRAIL